MLAQQTKAFDAVGGDSGPVSPPETKEKHHTTFMFIDSSNGGINAKPDKVVRSFVMKSARNKKPWSTRPKSPKTESSVTAKSRRQSSSRTSSKIGELQISTCSSRLECDTFTAQWENWTLTSPSSTSDSVFSSNSSNGAVCESPASTYTSPSAEYGYADDACGVSNPTRPVLPRHTSFTIDFTRSFDSLAVRLDANAEYLLHQFVEDITPRLLPIDLHRSSEAAAASWVTTSIQSPIGAPFIYAALTSAARAAKLNPEGYKWRAVSEVNRLLADPGKNTDDTTIATVLILLALEEADLADPRRKGDERRCSVSVNDAHLSGLSTMIGQRGGLAALESNRCLQVCIFMHSIAQAITTFKPPYALLFRANGEIEDYATVSFQTPHTQSHILRAHHNLGIDAKLLTIISTISVFISDLSSWYDTGTSVVGSLDLQKHASLLMYRLFDWYDQNQRDASRQHTVSHGAVNESICLALLLFMVMVTEPNTHSFGSRLSKATAKLHASLQQAPMHHWANAPDLIFWTLTMGALGAKSLPKNSRSPTQKTMLAFFTQYCRHAIGSPDMASAELLLERMKTCLWVPYIFDDRVKRLWVSMGLCRAEVVDLEDVSSSEGEREQVDDKYALGQSTTMRFFGAEKTRKRKRA
ncbi:hypothetical protein BDW02DRAFT_494191 [Decorospora gaudefroyi]|uniref:Transcription factor domain-containing protein n=1 Tax=Decorospora gaudefroyi TaxID=184978 RepID=A0A6A5KJX1_9PLEO|nr:hypothetical protein BDW02DRAFT_494191 [Decorospora gaudefroyi]